MPFLKTEQSNIFYSYIHNGSGETVVLINSLGTNLVIWEGVAAILKDHFNILMFDKRGHGLSSNGKGDITIEDYADDLIAIMDHLSLDRVHLVGLSIGGLIAMSMTLRYPERVRKLVLSNTGARIGSVESWNERIAAVSGNGLPSMSSKIVTRWLSETYRKNNPGMVLAMTTMLDRTSDLGYIGACGALRDADLRQQVKDLDHPVRFIGGSEDPGTPTDFINEQASLLGTTNVVIIPGVGHLPCIEAPAEMAAAIREFLGEQEKDLYTLGMKTRRSVLGDAHVERAEANKTAFDMDFQEYIVRSAWGSIWARPQLTKRERSLITLSLLAALGHDEEFKMHLRACRNTGATESDIKEAILHTAIYAGVPVANHAMKIAKNILDEIKEK